MRFFVIALCMAVPALSIAQENLASKISRLSLNQNEPAIIKLGTHGITTLEFPSKIEAIDGYGFSVNPAPDGPDLFQISFNKGTNYLSLKATHEGVEGNLTIVLDGKVYCLFCTSLSTSLIDNDLGAFARLLWADSITDSITICSENRASLASRLCEDHANVGARSAPHYPRPRSNQLCQ
jgi:hypothetical protein